MSSWALGATEEDGIEVVLLRHGHDPLRVVAVGRRWRIQLRDGERWGAYLRGDRKVMSWATQKEAMAAAEALPGRVRE